MNANLKLYKVTAFFGAKSDVYYVVAPNPSGAQEAVEKLHRDKNWSEVDSVSVDQLAEADAYGKPNPLILA